MTDDILELEATQDRLCKFIEAAEAEKAPENFVNKLKIEKLQINDRIMAINMLNESYRTNEINT
jgi:hypothetical protein|tara:strand:- start:596 stop:787 length:192 start_codon:yes stop_codon:yes gene_type:complete